MVLFLTSSPTGDLDGKFQVEGFDWRNGFKEELSLYWEENCRCMMVAAYPDNYEQNDRMRDFFADAIRKSGLQCSEMILVDGRRYDISIEEIQSCHVIFLGGGHVPTQNQFFRDIDLRNKLKKYDGVIVGISAGSMNAADIVYAQPEEEGESVNPSYVRFISGLGLTDINILPHYQMVKDKYLDGKRLFEDITIPDSKDRKFLALPDGSFLKIEGSVVRLYGDGYILFPDATYYVRDTVL